MSDSPRQPSHRMPVDFDPFAESGEAFALTEAQREIVAVTLMGDEANCAYNECFVLVLRGPLVPESLRNALVEVVRRHAALRLRIDLAAQRQHLLTRVDVDLPVIDLGSEEEVVRASRIEELLDEQTRTPFDLDIAPLWRARLIRETDDRHTLVFTAHHLVVDGWSSAVLFQDLARCYAADRFGIAADLPPAASYAQFLREQLGPEVAAEMEADTEYWLQQFSAGVQPLDLPVDAPRPAFKTWTAGRQALAIDPELYQALRKLASAQHSTLFVTLLAAFQVLLARLGRFEELVIGIPMASQALEDNGHLIAHGVNTLPLLCRIDPNNSFRDHLESVRRSFLDAQAHQHLTFGTLVQRLRLPRDPGRNALVPVLFNIDRLGDEFDFGEVAVASVDVRKAYFNFEFGINAIDDGERLILVSDYNADLFKADTVQRWLSHYRELLKGIVADPSTSVAQLPLLARDQRQQVLVDWNATDTAWNQELRLDRMFEAQAERSANATAVSFEGESLSWRELNACANRLAHALIAMGVEPDTPVAICAERSLPLVVGLLAILKAGGAYVPLDPDYPRERLAQILADVGPGLLLADAAGRDALAGDGITLPAIVELDKAASKDSPGNAGNPELATLGPDHLAYVIYTSGSTGTPKGAMNAHAAVANRLLWMQDMLALDATDAVLQKTPVSFDVSVWELFLPLVTGARLVMARPGGHMDPAYIAEILRKEEITTVHFVPSMLAEFLRHGDTRFQAGMRRVVCSGEALSRGLAADFLRVLPGVELYNLYGPTETAVDVTVWQCTKENIESGVPIGRPVANTRIYILDSRGEPVPVGVPGEIFIAGAQVGRGYLNREQLTRERFVEDPFASGSSARMYRTGDLGRWRPDGAIEYLGRNDFQVKLRGFRIELGEIEACLGKHDAVREAVVVALGKGVDQRLVAYVVADSQPDLADTLRHHLQMHLPAYMVPSIFVPMSVLPLTPSGKLDRRALPAPAMAPASAEHMEPRTDSEALVVAAFNEVLERTDVGVLDNFFDLGGHSLLAARLIAHLQNSAKVDLPLRNLFERPTPEQLAAAIDALGWARGERARPGSAGSREELEL